MTSLKRPLDSFDQTSSLGYETFDQASTLDYDSQRFSQNSSQTPPDQSDLSQADHHNSSSWGTVWDEVVGIPRVDIGDVSAGAELCFDENIFAPINDTHDDYQTWPLENHDLGAFGTNGLDIPMLEPMFSAEAPQAGYDICYGMVSRARF